MNTSTRTGRIGKIAAACIGIAALSGGTAVPAQAASQTAADPQAVVEPLSDDIMQVHVSCLPDGIYKWSASYTAGMANTQYDVYADYRFDDNGFGSSGGNFSVEPLASPQAVVEPLASTYHGVMATGGMGIGSTSTYTGGWSDGISRVYVTVTINGYTQEGWDDC